MLARIRSRFDCTPEVLWERISRPASLQYVAAPFITFRPEAADSLDSPWEVGRVYELRLALFGVLPLGRHHITLEVIDREKNRIVSSEGGLLARTWNHTITFEPIEGGGVAYCDEVEIRAGVLTPFIWLFAHLFYRHRQRRWKRLLKMDPAVLGVGA